MKAKIEITIKDWTGWTPQQPQPETSIKKISVGDNLITQSSFADSEIIVKSIDNQAIILITNHLAPIKIAPETKTNPREDNLRSLGIDTVGLTSSQIKNQVKQQKGMGIDLRTNYDNLETKVALGQSIKFITQTMDCGRSYLITFLKIIS